MPVSARHDQPGKHDLTPESNKALYRFMERWLKPAKL
ncbi:MAG: hypothetical protein RL015_1666 [Verrucomicrobiota bacterium]